MKIDRPIAISITLFIILLLMFFLTWPEYNTFMKLRTDLGEKIAEYNAQYDYYATIDKVDFDLQGRKDDIAKIDDALPKDSNLGKIVYFLQKTANENGLTTRDLFLSKSSLSAASQKTSNSIQDIVFSIDLVGNYPSLENFIVSLEKSSRIFEVANVSFGAGYAPATVPVKQGPVSVSTILPQQTQNQQIMTFSLQIKTHSY